MTFMSHHSSPTPYAAVNVSIGHFSSIEGKSRGGREGHCRPEDEAGRDYQGLGRSKAGSRCVVDV